MRNMCLKYNVSGTLSICWNIDTSMDIAYNTTREGNTMKKNYRTKQKRVVASAVESTAGAHFTVDEIYAQLRAQDPSLGRATVYRHINEMLEEGLVRKYSPETGRSACFEYIMSPNSSIYHFKCTGCNELIHVDCPSLAHISEHLLQEHGFMVDTTRVVFVGECEKCRKKL